MALARTANSRAPGTTEVFGWAGNWNHNYNWILEDSPSSTTSNFQPTRYTVEFPDGRVETFRAVTWDSAVVYRVRPGGDARASTSSGVRERFLQLNLNNMYAYLVLPDGGAVEFKAQQYQNGRSFWYKKEKRKKGKRKRKKKKGSVLTIDMEKEKGVSPHY